MTALRQTADRLHAANYTEFFKASYEDLRLQAAARGLPFWRAMSAGFVAAMVIGLDAVSGQYPF